MMQFYVVHSLQVEGQDAIILVEKNNVNCLIFPEDVFPMKVVLKRINTDDHRKLLLQVVSVQCYKIWNFSDSLSTRLVVEFQNYQNKSFCYFFLYHATQWVPLPDVSSRFNIPHSFFLGLYGKLSRTNTPRNLGILSFSTASIISKFVSGLLVNSSPSTKIMSLIYIISEIIMSNS